MALVRSVIEAMYTGAWVIAKASERDAEKIRQDKFDFPGTGTIVSEADAAFQTGGFFAEAKKGNWKTLTASPIRAACSSVAGSPRTTSPSIIQTTNCSTR